MLILSFAWLFAVILLISRALRQRALFRDIEKPAESNAVTPALTVIVPARNEAQNIKRCLQSLLAQNYPGECLRIAAVDDNSTDGTADIIAAFQASGVVLVKAPLLPPGWTGKSHACWMAAAFAAVVKTATVAILASMAKTVAGGQCSGPLRGF